MFFCLIRRVVKAELEVTRQVVCAQEEYLYGSRGRVPVAGSRRIVHRRVEANANGYLQNLGGVDILP